MVSINTTTDESSIPLEPESPLSVDEAEDKEAETIEVVVMTTPVLDHPPTPVRKENRKPVQRRRKARRRRSSAPLSPQCHHSSLADKASDYEDIWGTSPGASHDEEDDHHHQVPRPILLANEEDMALSDRTDMEDEMVDIIRHVNSTTASSSSSNSTLEKMTSASSDRREFPASRSLSSSPEQTVLDDPHPEDIKPPSPFQEKEAQRLSVTIIEIRNSPTTTVVQEAQVVVVNREQLEKKESETPAEVENKENVPHVPADKEIEVPVRRRTSCSSTESRGETNSRRTSPLYSEPADALPPQLAIQARLKNHQQGRPLPLPPFPSGSSDFTTFTKDGYVRCTLPSLAQSQSNPRVNVLPPTGQRSSIVNNSNRGKQISMPKLPRPSGPSTSSIVDQRKAYPSTMYLPAPGDDSITIQVIYI